MGNSEGEQDVHAESLLAREVSGFQNPRVLSEHAVPNLECCRARARLRAIRKIYFYSEAFSSVLPVILFLVLATAPLRAAALPNYFPRVLTTEEGLPQNSVTAIVQTHDGYLWIGTYDGLARYDGHAFTIFNTERDNAPQMPSSRVVGLFEDDESTLWIAHESGELTRFRNGRFETLDFRVPWENRKIVAMARDETRKLWLLNEEGRMASMEGDVISVPNPGSTTKIASLVRTDSGRLWIAYAGLVFSLTNNQLVALGTEAELGGYVTGIAASGGDSLWIFTGDRLRKWTGGELVADLGRSPWEQSSVSVVIELRSGALAVGTLDSGVYIVFPEKGALHFDRSNGFPHDWTRCLVEDREGTLWAGTGSGGLVALRAGNVATVNPPDLWHERDLLSVTATPDGSIWIGTEGIGLYRFQNHQWTRFAEEHGFSNVFVWSASAKPDGELWAGTWGGGVYMWKGEQFVPPVGLEGFNLPAPAILHSRNNITWIGTGAGLLRYKDGQTTLFGRNVGLERPDVRAIVEDDSGGIWFGMMGGGLACLRDGTVRQFHQADGLSSEYVQALRWDKTGVLWIGTYGGGINRWKDGRLSTISMAEGLPNNVICHIEDDESGNLWFSSRGGIFRVAKTELNQCADGLSRSVACLSYGKGDGMPTLECTGGFQPAGCRTGDGRLWFPTTKGLVVIDPANAKPNQLPPPVVIESVVVNGKPVPVGPRHTAQLIVRPNERLSEIRYTALTFVATEKVRFRYRLKGLETEWNDAGNERVVNYSYVPPGNYVFELKACNSDGIWNETGASLSFVAQPHLWQRWWFQLLEVLLAAALLIAVVLVISRRRMRLKLERLERQRAIERERARIAQDIHDNLGASLTRISLLSQSAHSELENPARAATQLDRIYDTARELTRAMDEIVWAVNPQHDTLDSLANYLGKFAQDFLGPLQIRCRLDVPVELPHWPVTAEMRHNLFLAFKEALHNVVKHAGASEVTLALSLDPTAFTFVIRDNGRGFLPNDVARDTKSEGRISSGNGLVNMRGRLEKMNGALEVEGAPRAGTTVRFRVPVIIQVDK